jgi:hypothetical protein
LSEAKSDNLSNELSAFVALKQTYQVVPLKVAVITEQEDTLDDAGPMRGDPGNFHVLDAGRMEEGVAGL